MYMCQSDYDECYRQISLLLLCTSQPTQPLLYGEESRCMVFQTAGMHARYMACKDMEACAIYLEGEEARQRHLHSRC